jgi:hypothetical protein
LEVADDEVPMDPTRAVVRTAGLVASALDSVLPVVEALPLKRPRRDPEDLADLCRSNAFLEILLDRLQL